jgi:rod shape-determining protein MreD
VGTSIFALSGLVLGDPSGSVGEALRVIPIGVVYDVLLTPVVLPPTMRLLRRLRPPQVAF